ncbi:MAG: phage holin family protein [Candidatus Gracilibacteria bacterium]|nr:phage holin family protein [Candidatus Gracilibacteria bacterium]
MKIFFSILFNAIILYLVAYFLAGNTDTGVAAGIIVEGGWKTYVIGGVILGIINITIKPILKIISLPFYFITFGLFGLVINGAVLKALDYTINSILKIDGVHYIILGWTNFIIAVAIFTFLNMFYSLIFKK